LEAIAHKEERGPNINRKQAIEILDGGAFNAGRLCNAGVGHQNIEAAAHDVANCAASLPAHSSNRDIENTIILVAVLNLVPSSSEIQLL